MGMPDKLAVFLAQLDDLTAEQVWQYLSNGPEAHAEMVVHLLETHPDLPEQAHGKPYTAQDLREAVIAGGAEQVTAVIRKSKKKRGKR